MVLKVSRAASLAILAATIAACSTDVTVPDASPPKATQCAPDCAGRVCGPDGCGGQCGECATPLTCTSAGLCEDCAQSCSDLGLACGTVCGVSCGTCAPGQVCADGVCTCSPACAAATCGQPDGCGGTCGACPIAERSCPSCALELRVVERRVVGGVTRSVLLGLAWSAQVAQGVEAPVLADLRFKLEGPGSVTAIGVSPGVLEAGKELRSDPASGRPFITLQDGTVQIIVWSPGQQRPLPAGDWLFVEVTLGDGVAVPTAPVLVSLVAREGILAPEPADEALWGSSLDTPLVLWAR